MAAVESQHTNNGLLGNARVSAEELPNDARRVDIHRRRTDNELWCDVVMAGPSVPAFGKTVESDRRVFGTGVALPFHALIGSL